MKKIFVLVLVVVLALPIFSACSQKSGEISVYFKDAATNNLNEEKRSMKNSKNASIEEKAKFAVGELIKGPANEKNAPVISKDAALLKLEIKGGVATVNMSSHYLDKKNVDELLLRFALVKTLCSIEGIDGIVIQIEGNPLVDVDGKEVGLIKKTDVVDKYTTQVKEEIKVKLYFPNMNELNLGTELRTVEVQNSLSPEKTVINELMNGPEDKSLSASIPKDTKLLDIETKDGVCSVNFSSEFIKNAGSSSLETTLILYSIVNSLCELDNVESVQILINGESGAEFGNFVLDNTYEESIDLIG